MTIVQATIVTAVNNDQILADNLMRSPMVASGQIPVIVEKGHSSAGKAYNAGLLQVKSEYVIFAHQDVYFPPGWDVQLQSAIEQLEKSATPWAVLGVWGIQANGRYAGQVWCTGGNHEHTAAIAGPTPVVSIDEIVIIFKRSSGLQFDEQLPGYHLYATDIILQAKSKGLGAYAFQAPVIHNSKTSLNPLDRWYFAAYHFMQKKWRGELPFRTCVIPVTRLGWPLYKQWLKNEVRRRRHPERFVPRHEDALLLSQKLGYESKSNGTPGRPNMH